MKFSKIACATLLGASLSLSLVHADAPQTDPNTIATTPNNTPGSNPQTNPIAPKNPNTGIDKLLTDELQTELQETARLTKYHKKEIKEIQKELKNSKNKLNQLEEENSKVNNATKDIESERKKNRDKIDDNAAKINEKKKELEKAKDNSEEKRKLNEELQKLNEEKTKINEERNELIKKLGETSRKQQEIQQKKNETQQEIEDNKQKLKDSQNKITQTQQEYLSVAKEIIKRYNKNMSSNEQDIANALASLAGSKDNVTDILSSPKFVAHIRQATTSVQEQANLISNGTNRVTDIVRFNSAISQNNRLAKLSNPFNENLALAYAINSLKDDRFADMGDSLSSVVKNYTDRFKHDNNLWANIIGAKADIKDSANPEIYGFSIGYDKAFDNTIFGGFATIAKSKADSELIKYRSNNYQIGAYTRSFIDANEIDTKISFGFNKNDIKRIQNNQENKGEFNTKFLSLELGYGYVFGLTDNVFIKPLIGLEYTYLINRSFNEDGAYAMEFARNTSKLLSTKAGAEFRGYFSDASYVYVTPAIQRDLYKSNDNIQTHFIGSSYNITLSPDDTKHTYLLLQSGVELAITNALSANVNFGIKARSDEKYYNGSLGVRYKF